MANTTADKLALLEATKAAMKSAINGSGSTVGDVFSAYPAAITSGKSAIARAVTDKGVETAATETFAQMAENIGQIETGGHNLVPVEITFSLNNLPYIYAFFNILNSAGPVSHFEYVMFQGDAASTFTSFQEAIIVIAVPIAYKDSILDCVHLANYHYFSLMQDFSTDSLFIGLYYIT